MPSRVISVIDDDPSVRESTIDLLNSAGFLAETYVDAEEFLEAGAADSASCIIADMRMPGMSGLDLYHHLLKAGKSIPMILITAFPREYDHARARELGCNYLSKPFSESELLSYIQAGNSPESGSQISFSGNHSPTEHGLGSSSAISEAGIGAAASERSSPVAAGTKPSLFHEAWWLSATTDGQYEEAVVEQDGVIVGRLPYMVAHRGPFRTVRMPPFTHLLGPAIDSGAGKQQTRLVRRLTITRTLIDKLPANSFFVQSLDPSLDGGLASADALAFQERKFAVSPQYTFELDCLKSANELWAAMNQKTRQPIRRAEEQFSIRNVDDPRNFMGFYLRNMEVSGQTSRLDFKNFPALFAECRARDCGVILGAFDHDATPVAMTYLVWGHGTMYYLLSTRSEASGYGAVSLLLWTAMKHAHELRLVLDLDGVYSGGTVRFLSRFGGQIKTRLTIRRSALPYRALQFLKRKYLQEDPQFFT